MMRRLIQWLGIGGRAYRAITRGARDGRSFRVWCTRDNGIVLTDALGENWLRSTNEPVVESRAGNGRSSDGSDVKYTRMGSDVVVVLPNPEIIQVVRRYGYGDASLN
ncbi:MAG: hypothetical protein H7X80_10015 [bacterium]|nr:hypothetical protein [Candidatus Kapabacteria bacterium]